MGINTDRNHTTWIPMGIMSLIKGITLCIFTGIMMDIIMGICMVITMHMVTIMDTVLGIESLRTHFFRQS
jgi:hypothetical protein